ncbi:hypothetical protein [Colwellia asteriadis]
MPSHNERLRTLLDSTKQKTENATTQQCLSSVIEDAIAFDGPIEFNNTKVWLLSGLCLLVACFFGYLIAPKLNLDFIFYFVRTFNQCSPIIFALIMCGFFMWLGLTRNSRIDALSDEIYRKDLIVDAGMIPQKINGVEHAKKMAKVLNDFQRGNHYWNTEKLFNANFSGSEYSFAYQYYCFHYVTERREVVTSTDSEGRTTTRTVMTYVHSRRYGILFDFSFTKEIEIKTGTAIKSQQSFTPASIEFNKRYWVKCKDDKRASKFLKPTVVLAFEDLDEQLKGVHFEVNNHGKACLSTAVEVFENTRKFGLRQPQQFLSEINEKNEVNRLNELLLFAHKLMTLTDNNFK